MPTMTDYVVKGGAAVVTGAGLRAAWGNQGSGYLVGSLATASVGFGGLFLGNMMRRNMRVAQAAEAASLVAFGIGGWVGYEKAGLPLRMMPSRIGNAYQQALARGRNFNGYQRALQPPMGAPAGAPQNIYGQPVIEIK